VEADHVATERRSIALQGDFEHVGERGMPDVEGIARLRRRDMQLDLERGRRLGPIVLD
jgi:hypothetical protein